VKGFAIECWRRKSMAKRYVVELTEKERTQLEAVGKKGKVVARRLRRAQLLLLAADGYTDTDIASALHLGVSTVERTRKRFVEGGVEWALTERPRPGGTPKLQGKDEAFLIATACSAPPRGRQRWTLQLLADRIVEVGLGDAISDETIRRTLKKTTPSPG
jgi:transposase